MFWHRPKRDGESGGVPSRSYDPRVRSMRTGIDAVGVSAVGLGESPLMWHHFRPPNLWVASALTGALTNRVVLVSRWPGFRFWVFLVFVWVGYVLGDEHSLMGGSDDAWSGGLLDYLDDQYHVCLFVNQLQCCI